LLLLLRNQSNPIGVTASERATLDDPFFLFVFENEATREVSKLFSAKLNLSKRRYDLFEITLPSDVDLRAGSYQYSIYEKSSDANTDIPDTSPLEIGLAVVPKSEYIAEVFHSSNIVGYQHEST